MELPHICDAAQFVFWYMWRNVSQEVIWAATSFWTLFSYTALHCSITATWTLWPTIVMASTSLSIFL